MKLTPSTVKYGAWAVDGVMFDSLREAIDHMCYIQAVLRKTDGVELSHGADPMNHRRETGKVQTSLKK